MSIRKHTTWNLIGSLLPLIVGVLLIPLLITEVGLEKFGILTLIWALIGYFAIFDLGIGRALTYTVSRLLARPTSNEIPSVVRSGLLLTAAMGLLGALALAITAKPLAYSWLNVTKAFQADAAAAILITAIAIPMVTMTSGLRGVLEAFGAFAEVNLLKVLLGVANFAMPVVSILMFERSLQCIASSLVIARILAVLPHLYLVNKRTRFLTAQRSHSSASPYDLLVFGGWMTVSNLVSPLMVTVDRFLISHVLGASVVAYYTVPFDILLRLLVIPAGLTVALFPRLTSLHASSMRSFEALYTRSFKVVLAVMVALCGIVALSAPWGLMLWLGDEFSSSSGTIAVILSAGILFNGMAQVPHTAIQASGGVKATALLHVAECIAYIPILYAATTSYGLHGAAFVWVGRAAIDLIALRCIAATRIAGAVRV